MKNLSKYQDLLTSLVQTNAQAEYFDHYNKIGFAVHTLLLQGKEISLPAIVQELENPRFFAQTEFMQGHSFEETIKFLQGFSRNSERR